MPRSKIQFKKAKNIASTPKEITSSDDFVDFNETQESNTVVSPTKISENESQVSKLSIQLQSESISTLSNGSSLIVFDTYLTKWNLQKKL